MKRSKRKLTAAFCTITLLMMALVSGCGNGAASTKEGTEGLIYEPYEGSYVVTGYSGSDVDVVIPDTYNDVPVVKVDHEVFANSDIQSIVLGRNVQKMGSHTFYGASMLKSITVTSEGIDMGEIEGCHSLEESDFLADAYATDIKLTDCSTIASIALPEGLVKASFSSCGMLKNIKLPEGVSEVFLGNCAALSDVDFLPQGVATVYLHTCNGLTDVVLPDGLQEISIENCEKLSSVRLPNTVSVISEMQNCPKLSSINLPDSLTEIGHFAFKNSTSSSELGIPASVTSVGMDAFYGFGSDQKIVITGSTDGWDDFRKEWEETGTVIYSDVTGYWAGNCDAQIEYKNG